MSWLEMEILLWVNRTCNEGSVVNGSTRVVQDRSGVAVSKASFFYDGP